jgi:uncharacterized membrane protein
MRVGQLPDPIYGKRGKQRSVHNNYFTLPVIFIMISNHYAATYGHAQNWAVLILISAAAVSIRHFFNRKHKGVYAWQFLGAGAVMLGFTAWWTGPYGPPPPMSATPVSFAQVQPIIAQRCTTCHMPTPTFPGITQAPAGVMLNSSASIAQNAGRIYQQVAVTRIMPLGNVTQITEEERAMIARWFHDGAPTN